MPELHGQQRSRGHIKTAPPGFYTASQAMKLLGLDRRSFYNYVNAGKIKKHIPPLKVEGFYLKKEIDQLAAEIALFFSTHEEEESHTETHIATPEDAQGIYDVLESMGWRTASVEQRKRWYRANPQIDYVVTSNGIVQGYAVAIPYTPSALFAIMHGDKRAWDMTPADILPYQAGRTYDVYTGIATRKDSPRRTWIGFRLIAGFLSFLEELATRQGVYIRQLCAVSAEEDGKKLCHALGFVEQPDEPEDDHFPDTTWKRYILNLETSDSSFALRYREAVRQANGSAGAS